MSAERISYAAVLQRQAESVPHDGACLYWDTAIKRNCDCGASADSVALRQLARLVEEAEQTVINISSNPTDYTKLVAALAAGFQPDTEAQG